MSFEDIRTIFSRGDLDEIKFLIQTGQLVDIYVRNEYAFCLACQNGEETSRFDSVAVSTHMWK